MEELNIEEGILVALKQLLHSGSGSHMISWKKNIESLDGPKSFGRGFFERSEQ